MLCDSGPLQASQRVAIIGGGCDPLTEWLAIHDERTLTRSRVRLAEEVLNALLLTLTMVQ